MTTVNYFASLTDHSDILISVLCASDINSDSVQYVLKQFDSHKTVPINDAGRSINVKFSLNASLESNKWGNFQAHRQVYGLIYLAEATNAMESALTLDKFTKLKDQYGPSLYESRCVVFGIDTAIRPSHSNVFQFSSHEAWKSIDYDIKQLIVAIYYKLESKRQRLLHERQSTKVPALSAPFENTDEPLEMDSKFYRRRCTGRYNKHLGDIHLLLGLIPESLQSYNTALDMLMSAGDSVWIGCALEGLCIVSAMILFNERDNDKETASTNAPQSTYTLNPKNLILKQTSGLNLSDVKKYCIPSFSALVDKYREAIINYSKDKGVAIVELEACIKATKISSRAQLYLDASEFIQNAVYITLDVPNPERMKRYDVMGELYKDIDFKRKSFFYKRVAAMQCVSQQLSAPDWKQCIKLLMEAISNLSLDAKDFPNGKGWPSVIQRVWRELIFALDKEGDRPIANRHLFHVFLTMFPYMSENDERDIYASLESYAKSGSEIPHQLQGFEFELNLYKCPIIKAVLPQIDVDGIRPRKAKSGSKSVFIYTPSSFNMKEQNDQVINFDWCVNTPCRMDVEVYNPLSHCPILIKEFEFIIDSNDVTLLESVLFSFSVPPRVTSKVTVSITPLKAALLKIVGYKYTIFGVEAKCFFAKNKDIPTSEIVVNVISELPLLCSDFTGARVDYHENDIPEIVAYVGETLQLPFKLTNTGSSGVSSWDVSCKTKIRDDEACLEYDKNFHQIELSSGMNIALPVTVQPKIKSKDLKSPCPCLFVIKYAAQHEKDEWWRSLELDVNFVFRQSVEVTDLIVESSHDFADPVCNVKATVTSRLDDAIELTWNKYPEGVVEDSVTVPANCIYSFNAPLVKMNLPDNRDASDLSDAIMQHVKNVLNISWKMKSARNRHHHGDASYNFAIQMHDFSKFVNVPIVCSISPNQTDVNASGDCVVSLTDVTHFSFEFHNVSTCKQSFKVAIEIYQDQMNGFLERNLDDCIIGLGCMTTNMELNAGDHEDFPCDILILKEGAYCIRAVYTISILDKSSAVTNSIQCYSRPINIISES